jgi:nucleotide-binding universal stress UspA family protein
VIRMADTTALAPVVVGVDIHGASEHVLRYAAEWAAEESRQLLIVHVVSAPISVVDHDLSAVLAQWQEECQEAIRTRSRHVLGDDFNALVLTRMGNVAVELIAVARQHRAIAVVVGSRSSQSRRRRRQRSWKCSAVSLIEVTPDGLDGQPWPNWTVAP